MQVHSKITEDVTESVTEIYFWLRITDVRNWITDVRN